MSMPSDVSVKAETLRELHRLHQQLRDLRERLERGPRMIQAHSDHVARLETQLEEARAKAKALRINVDDKQVQLRARETHLQHRKQQLREAKSNKEYQALKEEIAADEMGNNVLADEILEGMERLDELDRRVAAAEAALAKGRGDADRARDEFERESPQVQADTERVTAELREAERNLPADFRDVYQRIIRSKGSDGLAPVVGRSCGGCNQLIPLNIINALMMSKPIFCRSCGRLLYLPEDAPRPGPAAAE